MAILYAESFAPWCEKARWALDHHGVTYGYREHVPLTGEPALRMATRRLSGRLTVPLLIDGSEVLMDSVAIARYGERNGTGAALFPSAHETEIAAWNATSETVMTCGRAMLLPRMRRMPAALREQLPPSIPRTLRGALVPLASAAIAYLMRKYAIQANDAQHEAASREALDALRRVLADGREFILGRSFSFADIAMATSLQFIQPVAGRYIALGPATREAWTHHGLAGDYADLLRWRDRLYEAQRCCRR
jgi:glutathione S-transferase